MHSGARQRFWTSDSPNGESAIVITVDVTDFSRIISEVEVSPNGRGSSLGGLLLIDNPAREPGLCKMIASEPRLFDARCRKTDGKMFWWYS